MISFGRFPLININTFAALLVSATLTACGGGGSSGGQDFSPTSTNNNTKPQSSVEASSSSSSSLAGEIPQTSTSTSSSSSKPSSSSRTSSSTGNLIDTQAPSMPSKITPAAIYNRVALIWSPATDNVAVVYYRIYRDQVLIDTLWAPEDSFVDFDVAPNKTYVYGISAGDGVKNWSPVRSVTVTTPSTPTQSVSSSTSSTSSSRVSSSSSRISATSSTSNTATSNSTSSRSSNSSSSNSSSSRTSSAAVDLTSPSLPDVKLDNAFASHVDLSWLASTDNVAVTGYKIYRDGTLIATVAADTLSYSDTSAQASHQYLYSVSAGDAAGNWSAQNAVFATTPAAANSGDITLVWLTPNARANGNSMALSELSGYELRYKRQTDTAYTYVPLSKLTLLYIIPSLIGDYDFEVAAIDNNNLYSEFKSLTPQ